MQGGGNLPETSVPCLYLLVASQHHLLGMQHPKPVPQAAQTAWLTGNCSADDGFVLNLALCDPLVGHGADLYTWKG